MIYIAIHKYLYATKLQIIANFQYRFNTLSNLIVWNLNVVSLLFFYSVAYRNHTTINHYTFTEMITFLVVVRVVALFSFHNICYELAANVKNGDLSRQLLLPQKYFLQLYFKTIGNIVIESVCGILLLIIISIIMRINFFQMSFGDLAHLLIAIMIGSVLSFQIGLLIGLFAFWLEEIHSIIWSVMVMINLLSGQFIPLDFFPGKFSEILIYLPFSIIGYFPTKIIIGSYSHAQIHFQYLIYICWSVGLYLFIAFLWKSGLRKYTGVGN